MRNFHPSRPRDPHSHPLLAWRSHRRCAVVLAHVAVVPVIGQPARPPTSATSQVCPSTASVSRPAAEERAELIAQLGDRRWEVRERAAQRLKQFGAEICPELAEAYRCAGDYEVRLRIREIAEYVFLRQQGFLGVGIRAVRVRDARISTGRVGVLVARVLPGTAAERAGIEVGDVLVLFNSQSIPATDPATSFTNMVIRTPAGTKATIEGLRRERYVKFETTLGSLPTEYLRPEMLNRSRGMFEQWWREHFERPSSRASVVPTRPE